MIKTLFFLMFLLAAVQCIAQPGGGGDPGPGEPVPFSGIEFLLAGGIAYGVRNIYRKKK